MKLTYKDIKESVRRLCFLEEAEYEEYDKYMIEAVNFALLEVARQFPIKDRYVIRQDFGVGERGYVSYDLMELTKDEDDNRYLFMGFADKHPIICMSEEGGIEYGEYNILEDRFLVMNKSKDGEYLVFYKRYPKRITELTKDEHEIEFGAEVANLIPLLSAWRIFKDDDETKAAMYYNEYLRMKDEIKIADEVRKNPFIVGYFEGEGVFA